MSPYGAVPVKSAPFLFNAYNAPSVERYHRHLLILR